jgi:hypothetical protein
MTGSGEEGKHYEDCAESDNVHPQAMDEAAQDRLWAFAESQLSRRLDTLERIDQHVERIAHTSP